MPYESDSRQHASRRTNRAYHPFGVGFFSAGFVLVAGTSTTPMLSVSYSDIGRDEILSLEVIEQKSEQLFSDKNPHGHRENCRYITG